MIRKWPILSFFNHQTVSFPPNIQAFSAYNEHSTEKNQYFDVENGLFNTYIFFVRLFASLTKDQLNHKTFGFLVLICSALVSLWCWTYFFGLTRNSVENSPMVSLILQWEKIFFFDFFHLFCVFCVIAPLSTKQLYPHCLCIGKFLGWTWVVRATKFAIDAPMRMCNSIEYMGKLIESGDDDSRDGVKTLFTLFHWDKWNDVENEYNQLKLICMTRRDQMTGKFIFHLEMEMKRRKRPFFIPFQMFHCAIVSVRSFPSIKRKGVIRTTAVYHLSYTLIHYKYYMLAAGHKYCFCDHFLPSFDDSFITLCT